MSWIDNEDHIGVEFFARTNSDLMTNKLNHDKEQIVNDSFQIFNPDKEKKISSDDFLFNYDDYIFNKEEKSLSLINFNSSHFDENTLNNKYDPHPNQNIFLKRTYFDLEELEKFKTTINNKGNFINPEISLHERMSIKNKRTKFLLKKTRRGSISTDDIKENEASSDGKNTSINNSNLIKEENLLKKQNFISNSELKDKKLLLKQKNREAAQKSRLNKKIEFELLKDRELHLREENKNLKIELNKIKEIISVNICKDCKKNFGEMDKLSRIKNIKNANTDTNKDKFQIIQNKHLLSNFTNMSNSVPSQPISKLTVFTGILVIVCLIGNLIWNIYEPINSNKLRILLNSDINLNETLIQSSARLPRVPNIEDFNIIPQVYIDDKQQNKSFYLKFIDYIKWTTGFSKSENIHNEIDTKNNTINSNIKNQFLGKHLKLPEDKLNTIQKNSINKIENNQSCINTNSFDAYTKKKEKEYIEEQKYLDITKKNSHSSTCNITKFTGYFDMQISKNQDPISKQESCKFCTANNFENFNSSIFQMGLDKNIESKR